MTNIEEGLNKVKKQRNGQLWLSGNINESQRKTEAEREKRERKTRRALHN